MLDKLVNAKWPTEQFLISAKDESPFPIRLILRDSLYYPCSGFDGKPVKYLAGKILSFVYVDYGYTRNELFAELEGRGFRGYDLVASRSISEPDLAPQGWRLPPLELHDGYPTKYRDRIKEPFYEWLLFQRREDFPACHGPSRVSLLYLCADGVAAFYTLYVSNSIAPRIVAVIQPGHGFGMNWTNFEDPRKIFSRSVLGNPGGRPEFLLYGGWGKPHHYGSSCWPDYNENVCFFGGRRGRRMVGLWSRNVGQHDGR